MMKNLREGRVFFKGDRGITKALEFFFIAAFFLLYLQMPVTQAVAANPASKLEPDSAKECAICHYSWVDTFFLEHRSSELASRPEQPEAATSRMCFSCHDGSTVDSRKKVFNDRRHQVGVKPSDKITVPDILPLDKEGKMTCGTCHSAHGVATEPGIEKVIFLRVSHKNSEMCKMCHTSQVGGPEKGNHSVDKTTLAIPSVITQYGGYIGEKPNQVICESCHVAHGGFTDKRLVLPVDRPGVYPVLCEQCHSKTPGLNKNKSRNRFSHSVDKKPESVKIPSKWKSGNQVRLGAKGSIVCVTCHVTHNSAGRESLLAEKNYKDSLCIQCHQDQQQLIKGTKHDLTVMAPDAKNIRGKTASQSGLCSSCHLTHEGTGPFMWARLLNRKEQASIAICRSCHRENGCGKEVLIPKTGHPIGIKPKDEDVAMDFPLYTATGKKSTRGEIYCSSCHNTHQWDPLNPSNKGSKDKKGDITNSFLRAARKGSTLCTGCHRDQAAIEQTDHDLMHSAPEEKNMLGQLPGESGLCGSCHLAHGGAKVYMWARKIKKDCNAPMTELCLECHSEASCAEKKTIGTYYHPVGVNVEDVASMTLPLYLPEGKEDKAGMVFCSTCHDPHQWDPADPGKKAEEGTLHDSFLRQAASGNSPLCIICHVDEAFIEGTDHDLRVTAPHETNKQGLLPEESGLCGQCHAVHNAQTKYFLWARNLGPAVEAKWNKKFTESENIMTGLCTTCHQEGQCAEKKVPEYGLHPNRLYMALMQEKSEVDDKEIYKKFIDRFPIFTDKGKKAASGEIVCSTCHNSHLWNAFHPQRGTGKNREGNASDSFLRKGISFTFCASCHGEEAIFKFKYFHVIKGRKREKPKVEEEIK